MKKLMAIILLALSVGNAHAIKIFDRDLDLRVDIIEKHLANELPSFAESLGATKHAYKVNGNLPKVNANINGIIMACDVELSLTFKATQIDNSYCLLRAMLSDRFGKPEMSTSPKTVGKRCLIWTVDSGQVLLYTIGETAYIQYYVFRSIQESYSPTL